MADLETAPRSSVPMSPIPARPEPAPSRQASGAWANPFEGGHPSASDSSLPAIDYRSRRGERLGEEARAGLARLAQSMDALASSITKWRADIEARDAAEVAKVAKRGGWLGERLTRLADDVFKLVVLAVIAYLAGFRRPEPAPPPSLPSPIQVAAPARSAG